MSNSGEPSPAAHDVGRRTLITGALGAMMASPLGAQAPSPEPKPEPPDASVANFGAAGTGRSAAADQIGLQQAIAWANGSGRYVAGIGASYWAHPQNGLFLPAGVYDAGDLALTGNRHPFPALSIWAIPGSVVIRIPDGQYFLETDERLNWLFVSGINFVGGKGAFQHRFGGTNVNGRFVFERCVFDNYTECAIGNNAQDQPYLEVRGCTFMAAEGSRAIGIAWGGYADGCIIEGNAFLRNRYHLKLGPNPSGSIHILRNDFLRWSRATPLDAAIWFVPDTSPGQFGANAGWGTIVSGNKFGNENMQSGDVRVLIAREGPGDTRQIRAHRETFDLGGHGGAFLAGITIENNRVAGAGDVSSPFMRSWIAEVRNLSYLNNRHHGGCHTYLCEFMGARTGDYANMNWTVRIDPADAMLGSSPFAIAIANAPVGPQWNSGGTEGLAEETILPGPGDDTSFVLLALADRSTAFSAAGQARLTPTADHAGHLRAVTVAAATSGDGVSGSLAGAVPGRQGWLTLDLRRIGNAETAVNLRIFNPATGETARQLRYVLPSEWRRVRVPFTLPASGHAIGWEFLVLASDPARATQFEIARLYVYHGRAPQTDGHLSTLADGKWDGGHLVLGSTHIWEEGGALYVRNGGSPRGPADGRRLG